MVCFVHFHFLNVLRATTACNFSSLVWPALPNHWKNTVFRDFPTFSRICIFFLLTLLSSNLSLLSASSLLCFSSVHIVGSLTSKIPSAMVDSDVLTCDSLIYGFYSIDIYPAAWLRFQAPALYHPFCRFFYETVPDISFAVGILAPFSPLLHGYGFFYE